jgi:hypothetical protein
VSDRNQRLAMLQEIVDARRTIIKERAAHPDNQTTPGGKPGRMVKTLKMIGGGESAIPRGVASRQRHRPRDPGSPETGGDRVWGVVRARKSPSRGRGLSSGGCRAPGSQGFGSGAVADPDSVDAGRAAAK